jgi:hypothetical protein
MMGEKAPLADKSITHGICDHCMEEQLKKLGIKVKKEK